MARQRAQELMIKAQQSWVKHRDTPKYQKGDLIWLEGRHLRTNQPTAKLTPKRHGPFPIVQVMSPINYRLKLPTQWSIHDVFHIDLLTPYRETELHGSNYSRPAPDLIDNEEEYEVEKILDSRQFGRRRKKQYLIKWKGYPDSDNEWVDHKDIHAPEAIREFENSRTANNTHIRKGTTGKYPIIPLTTTATHTPLMSNAVNTYYLGSPERIFGAELDTQLITPTEARELCAKKYIRPHITKRTNSPLPLPKTSWHEYERSSQISRRQHCPCMHYHPYCDGCQTLMGWELRPPIKPTPKRSTMSFGKLKEYCESLPAWGELKAQSPKKVSIQWREEQFARAMYKRNGAKAAQEALRQQVRRRREDPGVALPVSETGTQMSTHL